MNTTAIDNTPLAQSRSGSSGASRPADANVSGNSVDSGLRELTLRNGRWAGVDMSYEFSRPPRQLPCDPVGWPRHCTGLGFGSCKSAGTPTPARVADNVEFAAPEPSRRRRRRREPGPRRGNVRVSLPERAGTIRAIRPPPQAAVVTTWRALHRRPASASFPLFSSFEQ